ncbi:SIMPL domain-containing protein [Thermaurantimonas aggregans]|uniref:SIMPL domain-containing protein n=1 Tax=Thermaurantimonas aggregans TaxID=2173829 RepID=A0A401XP04_9FLAO|nr:SIMPL domain-containing protein [Thermaurantimonas aggregans]GCD78722.1 SIMPL domain-containing protein [Thermaurantimonas aggregans]
MLAISIVSLSAIIVALILKSAYLARIQSNDTISVTGLGNKDFDSDLIVWSGTFNRINKDLKKAYAEIDQDRETIKKYLISKGIKEENIVFQSININREFNNEYDANYNVRKSTFVGYNLSQSVTIESNEVDKVEAIARSITELINQGIEFYSNSPQYFYTKLAELKLEMIEAATQDAYTRAKKIAENSGSKVYKLKKASMGVFQIVAQNSAEDFTWGGAFNTDSRKKTASITVKLEYLIK